jgi:pimeloyl-ACP methyl ester carboxylesterase
MPLAARLLGPYADAVNPPIDVQLSDGRSIRVHEQRPAGDDAALTIVWHHGSPQTGALLVPLADAAADRDIRIVSFGRADYGGSSPLPDRDIASVAFDVGEIADALGIDRFAVMGASGGGPHSLACAALLPDRVVAAACFASVAPYSAEPFGTDGVDWFAGMSSDGASLRAALAGRAERERYQETSEFDVDSFIAADYAALDGAWRSLGADAGEAGRAGSEGLVDDDLALVKPWGFDVAAISTPVLLAQGGSDRVIPQSHAYRLLERIPDAELWLRPADGHVSILSTCPLAMDWLLAHA